MNAVVTFWRGTLIPAIRNARKLSKSTKLQHIEAGKFALFRASADVQYYPDKARAAVPLGSHKYQPDHPGYRPLTPDEEEYDTTTDQASSSTS